MAVCRAHGRSGRSDRFLPAKFHPPYKASSARLLTANKVFPHDNGVTKSPLKRQVFLASFFSPLVYTISVRNKTKLISRRKQKRGSLFVEEAFSFFASL